jgi:hypothetical protein
MTMIIRMDKIINNDNTDIIILLITKKENLIKIKKISILYRKNNNENSKNFNILNIDTNKIGNLYSLISDIINNNIQFKYIRLNVYGGEKNNKTWMIRNKKNKKKLTSVINNIENFLLNKKNNPNKKIDVDEIYHFREKSFSERWNNFNKEIEFNNTLIDNVVKETELREKSIKKDIDENLKNYNTYLKNIKEKKILIDEEHKNLKNEYDKKINLINEREKKFLSLIKNKKKELENLSTKYQMEINKKIEIQKKLLNKYDENKKEHEKKIIEFNNKNIKIEKIYNEKMSSLINYERKINKMKTEFSNFKNAEMEKLNKKETEFLIREKKINELKKSENELIKTQNNLINNALKINIEKKF